MMNFNTVEEVLDDLKQGKIVIVVDDEGRENEGDLICAAEMATTENINFMAKYAKGLICMPMDNLYAKHLDLNQMVLDNSDNHQTAFTVSIDHIDTTTGISAKERSITAIKCSNLSSKPSDFRRPGHMFPLISKDYGVLERNGHTEATVDLLKLANLKPCGICCEIMDDDGLMMGRDKLLGFAKKWDLKIISINQIEEYRKRNESVIKCVSSVLMPTKFGSFIAHTYINKITNEHHIALVMGDIKNQEDILCRVHSECLTGEVFHSLRCDCGEQLDTAMALIEKEKRGVLLYMRQEGRGIGLVNKLKAYQLQDQGLDTLDANLKLGFKGDERDYFIAAQILKDLEIKTLRLLTNNPDKIDQIKKYGFLSVDRVPLKIKANRDNLFYLKTKQERMNHLLDY